MFIDMRSYVSVQEIKASKSKGRRTWLATVHWISVSLDITEWLSTHTYFYLLKDICSLEGKLWQYFDHLMQRADSLEMTLILGNTEGKRSRRWQRIKWLDSITNSMDRNLSKFLWDNWTTEEPSVLQSMGSQRVRHNLVTEQQ